MVCYHYLAQWGPSEDGVIDMVCVATGYKVGTCKDGDGNTCEDLARSAEYSGNIDVANKIREFAIMYSSQNENGDSSEDVFRQQRGQQPYPNNNNNGLSIKTSTVSSRDKYSSFEDADAELIDDTTLIEHEPEGDIEITSLCDNIGSIPMKEVGVVTTTNNNENNQNTWNNNAQMTPRSGRHAMMKLGVSPVNNNINTRRGLKSNYSNPSPRANRARAFSWNQNSPMSNNDDDTPVDTLFQNEARGNRGLSNTGTPINNGGRRRRTSSTGLPPPSPRYVTTTPTNRNRRSRSQQRQHEPQSDMSDRESRNQRLSELRDELSSLRGQESHREGAPGVSGASVYSRSTSTSQSSTSYGTQLNQQLQVFVKAEEQDPLAISSSHFESLSQNELALKEEVNRLKAEKDRAEEALAKATMLTPMLSTIQSEDSRDNEEDDGVSKLTFLEHDDCNGQLKGVVSLKSNKINSGNTSKPQQTKTVEELMDIIAKEKAKSADLEKQVKVIKDENESSIKSHGETVKNQLQDMKSLCKSLHKAKLEVDNSKNEKQKAIDDLEEMRQKLEASEARVKELEKANEHNELEVDEQSSSEQVRTLKKKIKRLQQSDDDNTQKLWEANKLHKRAIQDKEDEYTETIRDLKIKHEKILIEKEDEYLQEIRDAKKKTEQSFEEREASYIKQLRDIKKKEQSWTEREDELLKQMNAEKLTSSFSELEIDNLIQQKEEDFKKSIQKAIDEKDEEFEKEVSKLKKEIERLKEEQVDADDDKAAVQGIKAQLKECKKELKQQQRKHKSEMAKIQNTMEMQKSKEGRLQSHIQSLEKQITDMVNDYESRLQDAFYG